MRPAPPHCGLSELQLLLRGNEEDSGFGAAAGHVESCPDCQRRLSEMAADKSSWEELGAVLADSTLMTGSARPDGAPLFKVSPLRGDAVLDELRRLEFVSPPSHPETLGRVGRYEVQRVIGSGGMGIVLLAHDMALNRPVALKMMLPHLANSGPARHRFAREARAAAAIVHEHVIAMHDVVSHERHPYLVMQYVPGQSLQERVDQLGPLSPREVLRIGIQAASGLAAAHSQGVVHRDIKPSNIVLENQVDRAVLTDFGLARAAEDASLTRTGVVAGTPNFMSPEQANGQAIGYPSDLFSLGATLYFAAAGRAPFRADSPLAVLKRICHDRHRPLWEVNPEVPFELSDLIDRLLEKNPRKRPAGAKDVAEAFSRCLTKIQSPPNLLYRRVRQAARHPLGRVAAVSFATALVGLTLAISMLPGSKTAPEPSEPQVSAGSSSVPREEPVPPAQPPLDISILPDTGVSPASEFWGALETLRGQVEELERALLEQ
jgi:eukaryotic-like serine/threonine-protein kinase